MTELYFHYSDAKGTLVGGRATAVTDLAEARAYAELVIRSLIMQPGSEDRRGWVLHVSDDLGDELLALPFASVLGRPH